MKQSYFLRECVLLPILLLLLGSAVSAQQQLPEPRYVPPDIIADGFDAHFQHMAILETDCRDNDDATQLVHELTRQGAVIAVVSSPQRMIGWVPPEARDAVRGVRVPSPGGMVGVRGLAFTTDELRSLVTETGFAKQVYNEADEALAAYLEWIRTPWTPERELAREQAELRYQSLRDALPNDAPTDLVSPTVDGKGDQIMISTFASAAYGTVDHTSFFLESKSGTGSWDWPLSVYEDYKTLYTSALVFWAAEAVRYGRTMTTFWHLVGRTAVATQLTGEAVNIGEATFIPIVLNRVTTGSPEYINGLQTHHHWAIKYNRDMRSATGHSQSIMGFIAYKGTPDEGIWPHASMVRWNDGKIEGMYFALDNQYWQAVPDPLANPYRNVIAHEIGHLWGAPDEYYDSQSSCDYTYRGIANDNCQRWQTVGSYQMRGWDGIMKGNYVGGTSRATPVHTGVLPAANAVPRRLFRTVPAGYRLTLTNCDGGSITLNQSTYIPMSHDYCFSLAAEPTHGSGTSTRYFEKWEFVYKNGTHNEYTMYGPNLSGAILRASRTNPITEIIAHYTSSPPDFMTANTTLAAWNAPYGHAVQPTANVALRWVSRYDMNKVKTIIEYDRAGSWVPLSTDNIVLYHPNSVPVGYWTGLRIHSVPLAGGSNQAIQPNREYRFRIVGEYNTVRGTPSNVATVRTRPSTPADTVFCHDAHEPNGQTTPRVLPSMGPGIDDYTVRGALTIDAATGEFSWYRPKTDYYRITAIGLSSGAFGTILKVRLMVREGSDFTPKLSAQRVGTTTWLHATYVAAIDAWVMGFSNDGEYLIRVEADITDIGGMWDLADRYTGKFGFGEYGFNVRLEQQNPTISPICASCVRLLIPRPYPGIIIFDPLPPPDLVLPTRPGYDPTDPLSFLVHHVTPPGTVFEEFEGLPFGGTTNPLRLDITPNTPPGEYLLHPKIRDIDAKLCELVIIRPEGLGGPLEQRIQGPYGTLHNAVATPPEGFVFVGWGGDTVAVTNPLPVVLWKHKMIVARFRQKPCQPEPMQPWQHLLTVTHVKQGTVALTYGMQSGAGDGLEPGQVDLPPIPPPGTFDVRWINIPASQGSVTDIRAVKPAHLYQGRVQIGTGMAPARMQWSPPTLGANFVMRLKVGSTPEIDMHATANYTFTDEGVYTFTITVKEPDCPSPTEESDITVDLERIDPREFPCLDLELLLKHRRTHDAMPYASPFVLSIYEHLSNGQSRPISLTHLTQLDSTLVLRICPDADDKKPNRDISIIPDEDDPDKIKDTMRVQLPPFIPDITGDMFRIVHNNSGDWEMVSVPVSMGDAFAAGLYPDPSTLVFRFDITTGMYTGVDWMRLGDGYWLRTPTRSTLFVGNEVTSLTMENLSGIGEPYGYGWNMIGSISHAVPVASITQTPAGCMKAIFGWTPGTGYTIPLKIEPSFGYWVRLDPAAKLTIAGTGGAPPPAHVPTLYERTAAELPSAGTLVVRTGDTGGQRLALTTRAILEEERDILALPQPPPEQLFDARSENGTLFVAPGNSNLRVQHDEDVTLQLQPRHGAIDVLRVLDESGALLHEFRTDVASQITVPVNGTRLLRLSYATSIHPLRFSLDQSYPNPLRSGETVTIPYSLDRDAPVRLDVHDLLGRRVAEVASGMRLAGAYTATWSGVDDHGQRLAPGIYTYRLEADGKVLTRRCTILR
ncbi:MAG: FlgD immunoglobulin-like domain containing protein [Bacteroidota bacterium]|jgi:hypothetical protein|nr:FlgD immunoglobulin-like domain containing protein [Bacteroidota bacterium]